MDAMIHSFMMWAADATHHLAPLLFAFPFLGYNDSTYDAGPPPVWPTDPSPDFIINHPASEENPGGYGSDDVNKAKEKRDGDAASDELQAFAEENQAAQLAISEAMLEIAQAEEERAAEQYQIYTDLYLPGEIDFVRSSFAGIPVEQELAWASSGVTESFDSALDVASRELQGYGVDPSSPKYAQMQSDYALAKAAADAGARNTARTNVRDTNYERERQAVMIGRGIPATASGISSDAAAAYQGASGALTAGFGALNDAAGLQYSYSHDALNATLQREQMAADVEAAQWAAAGELGGAAIGAFAPVPSTA